MPQVKAKVACFIDNSLRNEGDVFEYNGPPCKHVVVVGDEGTGVDAEEPRVKPKWTPRAKRDADNLG